MRFRVVRYMTLFGAMHKVERRMFGLYWWEVKCFGSESSAVRYIGARMAVENSRPRVVYDTKIADLAATR